MRQLILLLINNGGILAFLLLEVLSLFLVATNNQTQQEIASHSLNNLTQTIDSGMGWVENKLALGAYADSLSRANRQLLEARDNMYFYHRVRQDSIPQSEYEQQYQLIRAEVVDNNVHQVNNYLVLNRGRQHGVRPAMGVIAENGLVGVVRDVSKDYALVMSMLNVQTRISAAIRRTEDFGSLTWDTDDEFHMVLRDIPTHVQPVVGDTIQTSGYSQLFPKGILIGTITEIIEPPGSNFYEIRVRLFNSLRRTRYAYIVDNLKAAQIEELLQENEVDE